MHKKNVDPPDCQSCRNKTFKLHNAAKIESVDLEDYKTKLKNDVIKKSEIRLESLKKTAEKFNVNILEYSQLPIYANEENVTGVLVLEKLKLGSKDKNKSDLIWQCPITHKNMIKYNDFYFNQDIGLAYPIVKNIPLLHKNNMIIASKLLEAI